jgi:hypothetical protein
MSNQITVRLDTARYMMKIGLQRSIVDYGDIDKYLKTQGFKRNKSGDSSSHAHLSILLRIASHSFSPDTKNFTLSTFSLDYTKPTDSQPEHFLSIDDISKGHEEDLAISSNDLKLGTTALVSVFHNLNLKPSNFNYCQFEIFIGLLIDSLGNEEIIAQFKRSEWIQDLGGKVIDPFATRVTGPSFRQVAYQYHPKDLDEITSSYLWAQVQPRVSRGTRTTVGASWVYRFNLKDLTSATSALEFSKKEALKTAHMILDRDST